MNYMDFIRPLSVVLFCLVARNISDIHISKLRFTGWIVLSYLLVAAAVYFSEILGSILILLIIVFMIKSNGVSIYSSILTAIFTMIILVICNTASGLILSRLYSEIDFYGMVADDLKLFIPLVALNYFFSQIISRLVGGLLHKRYRIKTAAPGKIDRKIVRIFMIITLLIFMYIYITAINIRMRNNPLMLILYVTLFVSLMAYTYFIFSTTIKETKLESSQQELKQLEEYTSNIESMYNDIRSIRHDYSNVLSSMAGYINDNDMEGLKEYFKNEIEPFSDRMKIENNNLGALAKLKETSLKGIFAVKLIKAQESGIDVIVDIKDDIYIEGIDILDINRVAGILLDNAYEAAMECSKGYIHVGFIKKENQISIVIINSLNKEDINIKQIFDVGFSSKGNDRGYGLKNVTEILDRYENIYLDTVIENNEFRQAIFIEGEDLNA